MNRHDAALILSPLGVGSFVVFMLNLILTFDQQLNNNQALVIEGLFAASLAILIYLLQWKNQKDLTNAVGQIGNETSRIDKLAKEQSDVVRRIDEVARVTAEMIAEERDRKSKIKSFWVDRAVTIVEEMKSTYEGALGQYRSILTHGNISDYGQMQFLGFLEQRPEDIKMYREELKESLEKIDELLDTPSLYKEILDTIRFAGFIDAKDVGAVPLTETLDQNTLKFKGSEEYLKVVIDDMDRHIQALGKLIEKIKTELPNLNSENSRIASDR